MPISLAKAPRSPRSTSRQPSNHWPVVNRAFATVVPLQPLPYPAANDDKGNEKLGKANLRSGSVLVRTQRQEILRAPDWLADTPQQRLQILAALHEINLRRVHDQQVRRSVVEEEVFIRLHYLFQVIVADGLLAGRVLFLQPLPQHIGRGLQVNDEVGRGHVLAKQFVVTVVNLELGVTEVEAGKQLVLFEDVVGDVDLVGIALHIQTAKLLVARDKERELRLEGRPGLAVVERPQKRIVFWLTDALGVQGFGNHLAQRALADTDGAFDCDVPGWLEKVRHGARKKLRSAEYLALASVTIAVMVNLMPSFPHRGFAIRFSLFATRHPEK